MNYLLLTHDSLDIGSITDLASSDVCSSASLYVGITRGRPVGKKTLLSLEFGGNEAMAEKEMENICGELRFRWSDIVNIIIYHRIGVVPVGEAYIVIAIGSSDAKQPSKSSLEAVDFIMEELEKRVPIWKREIFDMDSNAGEDESYKFDETRCDIQDSNQLPSKFVQISASEQEIVKRIQSFIERKREEIDLSNIVDYIKPKNLDTLKMDTQDVGDIDSCARINGTIIKQENSKCHLKIRKTDNKLGPQVQHDYLYALDNLMETPRANKIKKETQDLDCTTDMRNMLLERARNIEEHLNIQNNDKKSIYQRIKHIEDRLLYLESISPEYCQVLFDKPNARNTMPIMEENIDRKSSSIRQGRRKVYDVAEINHIIETEAQRI
ncbi:molybdopterin synthase catalytic subunit-like [Haematobia irritans]|uniref:molybdopterin synthase catalytic subunit-like n=1 Tax=Haematobia irritans TaxID=7368 RepID=UPI003F4F98CB